MKKPTKKILSERYFNELKIYGHCVPRFETTGEVMPAKVGAVYVVPNPTGFGEIIVKCTQSHPTHLVKLE